MTMERWLRLIAGALVLVSIGLSLTLLQPPSESPYYEAPKNRLLPEAGFICFSAGK